MSLSEQPFERHPALASWIERLANSQSGLSLGEWMIFLGSLNHALNAARAEGVAALQQVGEPVAWRYRDAWGNWAYCQAINNSIGPNVNTEKQPLYASPLPQQTALVEQGVEKIIGQHEPAACGASAPSVPPWDGGEALVYAQRLATVAAGHFGPPEGWKPLPDLMGVLSQIDNALTGLVSGNWTAQKIATAWYDGFVNAKKNDDWEDMYDWAALTGQAYAMDVVEHRNPPPADGGEG